MKRKNDPKRTYKGTDTPVMSSQRRDEGTETETETETESDL